MEINAMTHTEQALAHAQRAIDHYEKLIAGDGITCADLVVFGAELREALRLRAQAEKAMQEAQVVQIEETRRG